MEELPEKIRDQSLSIRVAAEGVAAAEWFLEFRPIAVLFCDKPQKIDRLATPVRLRPKQVRPLRRVQATPERCLQWATRSQYSRPSSRDYESAAIRTGITCRLIPDTHCRVHL